MTPFSATECIRFGWETFKKRPWFFIGSYLLYLVVISVISVALNEFITYGGLASFVGTLARVAVEMLAGMGGVAFALKAHDDVEHVSLADFWHPSPFWKYTVATLLYGLIFLVGLVLVIIPGIIWGIMFGFAGYFIIDKNMWPIEALKASKHITYGHKWELFLLGILSFLIVALGFICILVGLLVAAPVVLFAFAHAYRTLEGKAAPVPTM